MPQGKALDNCPLLRFLMLNKSAAGSYTWIRAREKVKIVHAAYMSVLFFFTRSVTQIGIAVQVRFVSQTVVAMCADTAA